MPPARSFSLRSLLSTIVLVPLLASCGYLNSLVQKPTVTFQRMDVRDVTFSQISVAFVFAVNNPNDIGIDLAQLSYQITVEGHAFVQGSTSTPLHVPARGVGQATVPLTIQYVELGQALEALFTRPSVSYTLSTTLGFGTPIGVLSIPLSTSGQLPVPHVPTVQFGSAGVRNLGLTGCDLAVVIHVNNTNAFAVPLGSLKYDVSLAGSPLLSSLAPLGRVGASSVTPVQLGAHVDFLSAGLGVARAIQGRNATIAFDGVLDLGVYKLPVHVAGKL